MSAAIAAGVTVSFALSACGSGARQDVSEPSGRFVVDVPTASFPASQRLSEHTQMVITVHNADTKTIPDVAVTVTTDGYNTSAQAFGVRIADSAQQAQQGLASASRPVWIVDEPPNPHGCQYSCASGGAGGAVTAYANTWALGALPPGHSVTFRWAVTAVKAGTHVLHWRVAAGLNGKAIAQLANNNPPEGSFQVAIKAAPAQAYVNNQGQVVTTP
jgi:hypothetical protein